MTFDLCRAAHIVVYGKLNMLYGASIRRRLDRGGAAAAERARSGAVSRSVATGTENLSDIKDRRCDASRSE